SPNGELSLVAVFLSRVILLGLAEIQRVSARLVACPRVSQRACHFLGVDRQDEAATGARLLRCPNERLLSGRHQDEKRGIPSRHQARKTLTRGHGSGDEEGTRNGEQQGPVYRVRMPMTSLLSPGAAVSAGCFVLEFESGATPCWPFSHGVTT